MASIFRPRRKRKDGTIWQSKTWYGRAQKDGKRREISLDTESRSLANKRLQEWLNELDAAQWNDKPDRHTFDAAAARFVDEHFPRIKASSAKRYVVSLQKLADHFGSLYLDEIGRAKITEFEVARREQGVTNSTIRRDIACLAALLRCAEEWEWISGNAANAFLRFAAKRGLKEAEPRTRYLSHEEEKTLLDEILRRRSAAKTARDRHGHAMLYAAVVLSIDTGLRREELMGLPWIDVDLTAGLITVQASRAKSSKQRQVPLHDRSRQILERMSGSGTETVLHRLDGKRYFDLAQSFTRLSSSLGITDLRWHDLRRTCGCRLIQDHGMRMEQVRTWLGHSSIEQTERAYAFLDVRHLQEHLSANATRSLSSPLKAQSENDLGGAR